MQAIGRALGALGAAGAADRGTPVHSVGRPNDRRGELLEAAARLFFELGYHGFTMDELASRLSINKASLYHYVDSKESLIFSIFERSARIGFDIFDTILQEDAPVLTRCRRFIRAYVTLCCTNIFFQATCLRGTRDLPERHRALILRMYGRLERSFTGLIELGQREGVFRAADPRFAALAIIGACCWVVQWFEIVPTDANEVAKAFQSTLSHALIARQEVKAADLLSTGVLDQDLLAALAHLKETGNSLEHAQSVLLQARSRLKDD